MRLAEPGWLILLLLTPLPWFFERSRPRIAWPSLAEFAAPGVRRRGGLAWMRRVPPLLRGLVIACAAVAMARPQEVGGQIRIAGQGVAIIVAIDQSSSMTAVDFKTGQEPVSRLDAAKATLCRFIEGRPDDLIGLVVFANYPDVACPLKLDHGFLLDTVRSLRTVPRDDDGTNMGDAIAWSLRSLRLATTKKKVLVLLTDGRNSPAVPNPLDPEVGARLARALGVTLHTIAIGEPGGVVRSIEPITKLEVVSQVDAPDFALLERLAKLGGGQAFTASDARSLDQVFHKIDELERSPVQSTVRTRYDERFAPWVVGALGLLAVDRLLSAGRLRRLP